jgi:hypothetical protein
MSKTPIAVLGIDLGKNSCSLAGLMARAHPNVVVVALAAKLARIAWPVLRHGRSFAPQPAMAA